VWGPCGLSGLASRNEQSSRVFFFFLFFFFLTRLARTKMAAVPGKVDSGQWNSERVSIHAAG
jgi:hypothetical protein